MPVTYVTFVSGSLALAGIFPFAGFWSKDEVLYETLLHGLDGDPILLAAYAMGLVAVFFTGLYTFRMVFLTFHGDSRSETAEDPHGVRWTVKFPLVVLGVLAAVAGFVNMVPVKKVTGLKIDYLHQWLEHGYAGLTVEHYGTLLHDFPGYGAAGLELSPLGPGAVSLGLALAGAVVAHRLYNVPDPVEHTARLGELKTVLYNNYYQDEYQVWIANGVTRPLARAANKFDGGVVDGVVNGRVIIEALLAVTFLAALVVFVAPNAHAGKLAAALSALPILGSLRMWAAYDASGNALLGGEIAFETDVVWLTVGGLDLHWFVGVDGISLPLVVLTTVLTTLAIVSAWTPIGERQSQFYGLVLLMEANLLGVFTALDFFAWFVFWEAVLVPMYFLIGVWGGPNRRYAAIKFFVYTNISASATRCRRCGCRRSRRRFVRASSPGSPASTPRRSRQPRSSRSLSASR
jgi:NADH:ubiquinone oxidoreductase subunit 5 (subunit L)/multisubunit Na+/H+ antiporter MnhA subunit